MVAQALRREAQHLKPGCRLPSVRALMARLRVSPATVRSAVARLAAEGVLEARPGHGTFVGQPATAQASAALDFSWQGLALGGARVPVDDIVGLLASPPPDAVNLASGYPSEELQATSLVAQAMARAARRPGVWGRMPLDGLDGLRDWFARQLGPSFTAREVVICPGSQSAITTTFTALAAPGAAVLMESPTYVGAIVAARAAGLRLIPVPTDHDGVRPDALARAFETTGARVFYAQPAYANPTGAVLAADRRRQVLDVVSAAGAILVEDDWCRDLSFERTPPRPLITDDANGHCVYLRSLTKSSAPGLRIGAMVARGAVLARLSAYRGIADFFVAGPLQEAALELVHAPAWTKHLRWVRAALVRRRDALAGAVRHRLGDHSLALVPAGGVHLWVRLPDEVDDLELARRTAEHGIYVSAGRRWFPAEATGSYVRLSYGCASEAELTKAVAVLEQCCRQRAASTVRRSPGAPGPSRQPAR